MASIVPRDRGHCICCLDFFGYPAPFSYFVADSRDKTETESSFYFVI